MILITGANGQLGQCFQQLKADFPGLPCLFVGSSDLDIGDKPAVDRFFAQHSTLRWVINCAAYTAVDKAESEPEKAERVNVTGVRNLADACARYGAFLIHFSTDYVYHGIQNTPYKEDDPVSPKSVYAKTKLAGEQAALQTLSNHCMVLRTSWVYAAHSHNFLHTMLRLAQDRPSINVVADQIGTPTYAPDLACTVLDLLHKVTEGRLEQSRLAGIWNYSNEGVASWYDFAAAIFELKNISCKVLPIETSDYPTPAQRPPFSVLNKNKLKTAFQLEIPHWRSSLKSCLKAMDA